MKSLKKAFSNKVVWYLLTRYLTYFIQFISSIIIAVKLGPYLFGIWGFILLLLNYFRIFDFGVSQSINILIVQNKEDQLKTRKLTWNAIYLVTMLNVLLVLFAVYYKVVGIPFFEKYSIDDFFILIIIVAIMTNYNVLLMNLYRIQNSLKELVFYQSSIPIAMFIIALILKGSVLLNYLLYANVIGNIICFIVFYRGKKIPAIEGFDWKVVQSIAKKGVFLFLYSISFYLIILSVKTLISIYYSVDEFGIFSFAYTLGNSVLLFLQAMVFIVFPKIISKLKGNNFPEIRATISSIRTSYVALAFGLVFLALFLIPFGINYVPKYQDSFITIGLVMLTVVLYTNSFGYGSFLMAQNLEKTNAFISFTSLVVNFSIALILILVFKVPYNFVIVSTIISYSLYAFLCVYFGKRRMGIFDGFVKNVNDSFPFRLLIPYLSAIVLILFELKYFMFVPLLVYILLNRKAIRQIQNKVLLLLKKPNIVDL